MVKEMKITLTASANNQEGIDSEFEQALEEVLRLVKSGYTSGANSRSDGDEDINLEWTEGAYEFETREV